MRPFGGLLLGAALGLCGQLPVLAVEDAAPGAARPAATAADGDWQAIVALDAGPRGEFRSREEALTLAREHLERQEAVLRRFPAAHPADPRGAEARVRLSDVLAARARLPGGATEAPALRVASARLLAEVEGNPSTSPQVKADAAYARVRQDMQDTAGQPGSEARRETLARAIRSFEAAHPADRRTPGLLVELATLDDDRPAEKRALLERALSLATRPTDAAVRARAGDDLRRLALLGRPLRARLPPAVHNGNPGMSVELASRRGRVVVLLFWASSSPPACRELVRLQTLAARLDPRVVEFLSISLDEDRAALAAAVSAARVAWPVLCDGRGWEGEGVRALGINALPTVWVLDRDGVLLTLNARDRLEEIIRGALAGKGSPPGRR